MKKIAVLIIICLLALPAACQRDLAPDPAPDEPDAPPGEEKQVFTGCIAAVGNGLLLLTGAEPRAGEIYTLPLQGVELRTVAGDNVQPEGLCAGMEVEVEYSGQIKESYPMQLSEPTVLTVHHQGEDLVGLYQTVIRDLYNTDAGLNDGISLLAVDLTGADNLTQADQSALLYLLGQEYRLDVRQATYKELMEEGLITDMQFETGLLISFADMHFEEEEFTFSVQKWRSGLGAYYFIDCAAVPVGDGTWSYTVGQEAIS